MRSLSLAVLTSVWMAAFAPFAAAQSASPFALRLQQGQTVTALADGGTISMPADAIGVATTATVTITYRGSTTATITSSSFTGALDFTFSGLPDLPVVLVTNQSFTLGVSYLPTGSNRLNGRLELGYTEGKTSPILAINVTGSAPEFALSYIPQGGNATPLGTGGIVSFPVTPIDATSNSVIVVTNRGTAPGLMKSVKVTGALFQAVGIPLPDTSIDAGRELRFSIAFTPKQLDAVTGTGSVEFVNRRVDFALQGSGSGPVYAYELVTDRATPIQPNQLITIPDAQVNDKSSITVRVRNDGNVDGKITAIAVQGTSLAVTDAPFLPLTLQPGQSATTTVTFTPTQAGRVSGRLRIGDNAFEITANGLGSILNYSYVIGPISTTVAGGGTISINPAAIGSSSSLRFQVGNTGTTPAPISSITVLGSNSAFTLSDLPKLPAEVPPGGTVPFTVKFTPIALGTATATLRIDNQTFLLTGSGNTPAALPDYRIDGASGTQDPLQQPAIGLTLASPYSLRVNGTLTLVLNSGVFSNDPAVQFATGGRTVSFYIPANGTRAVFPDGSNQMRLQTGSVAGTITLTPAFATEGGVDLTPVNAASMNLTVAQSAPRLLNAVITARTSSGFTISVTGYSTSRSVTQLDLQFSPTAGENVSTTKLSLNVESNFLAWYQTAASQQFGSLFSVSIPLTFAGDVKTSGLTLVETIQSVAATATNRQGTSNSVSVNLK